LSDVDLDESYTLLTMLIIKFVAKEENIMVLGRVKVFAIVALFLIPASSAVYAADGKAIYDKTCKLCHNAGIAGAPKFGDKATWDARMKKGMATLESSAIDGLGIMPAKGGNKKLSDAEVKAAVAYLVHSGK
jgi:cytochrome c5